MTSGKRKRQNFCLITRSKCSEFTHLARYTPPGPPATAEGRHRAELDMITALVTLLSGAKPGS
jgi:hypothetical protein